MLDININSPYEVRKAGFKVLLDALGPVGFARFMQQVSNGFGDYTKEKYEQPEMTEEEFEQYKADLRSINSSHGA